MNLETMAKKLTTEGLRNAQIFFKMKDWKQNYEFIKEEPSEKSPRYKYWWKHRNNGFKAGETFSSMEDCKDSALMNFLNYFNHNHS